MAPEKRIILVVEDDAELNELQRELLAVHGMESVPAYSGTEALNIVNNSHVDAVLLDIMLPEMDGFETCNRLRQSRDGRGLPIVILTALDGDEYKQRGRAVGADDYFSKPFDPDQVITTLRRLINAES
jgi:DNA-binding response OmpR family regulator